MRKSPPQKPRNTDRRDREHLTPAEVDKVISAARNCGRHGHRDGAMILFAYRHGLRVSELVSVRWTQIDLTEGVFHVRRRKNGREKIPHPLFGPELRALRKLKRDYPSTEYVFVSERKAPMTTRAFHRVVARAGEQAGLSFPIHSHMLRHSTGYKLVNDGQDTRAIQEYLGHQNIQHTIRYTHLDPDRFRDFWKD